MSTIKLTDNHFGDNAQKITPNNNELDLLRQWSAKCTLKELRKKGIITFSHGSTKESNDSFFTLIETENEVKLETGNLMGVLRLGGKNSAETLQIAIHSRFDADDNQFFLNYLLSKVSDVHFTELVATNSASMWEMLLALVFIRRFNEARKVGLFKQYKRFEYNDLNFRGKLDLDRHIKHNFPLFDKIAYSRREITFDHAINHLILHAAEKINKKWLSLFDHHQETRKFLDELKQHTPTWRAQMTERFFAQPEIHQKIRHPYFAEHYEPLRTVSLKILRDEGASQYQEQTDNDIEGVIFDGAWLWEEYLATILVPAGFIHADNEKCKDGISTFKPNSYKLYPDFRKLRNNKNSHQSSIILDAKYKRGEVRQSKDVHQVLAYMFLTGADWGGLIFPPSIDEKLSNTEKEEFDKIIATHTINTNCHTCGEKFIEKEWRCFTFGKIPHENKIEEFLDAMKKNETSLVNEVNGSKT